MKKIPVYRNEQNLSEVKILEKEASRLSDEATEESKMADDMLKDIAIMEGKIPGSGTVTAAFTHSSLF